MSGTHKVIEISILAKSAEPSTAIVQVNTTDTQMKFEITEDLAHKICADLERFLTGSEIPLSDRQRSSLWIEGREN
jgi:hypothetical protein